MSNNGVATRKKGVFDFETNTVKFGGEKSKSENIFICNAIKVPEFKYTTMEQADAGGGCYYGYKEQVEHTENNAYLILRDGKIIGWMRPYHWKIKSDLFLIDEKFTPHPIKNYAHKIENSQP